MDRVQGDAPTDIYEEENSEKGISNRNRGS